MRYSHLAGVIGLALFCNAISAAQAKNYTFSADMLGGDNKNVDISLFNQGGQLPGTYTVDILLNGGKVDTQDVVFSLEHGPDGQPYLYPCLTVEQLSRYGVKVEDYPELGGNAESEATTRCARISAIPQASPEFQFSSQSLLLSIPQVAVRPKVKGIAPRALWDDGIPALRLNYRASEYKTEYRNWGGRSESRYVELQPGLNLGAWRIRNSSTWQRYGEDKGKWQSAYTYAERGLYSINSRLTMGQRYTPSDIFDSVPFTGAMLASDESMVPYDQREFAPVVRGIARTQARIEVKQNGYTIYNTSVAPGPFELSDLASASGSGSDLQVIVHETDGSTQVFTVPYNTPAIALHKGYLKYNLMAGKYRSAGNHTDDGTIGQATMMYGMPWDLTSYGGLQWAQHYRAGTAGLGLMGGWGAMSVDATQAEASLRKRGDEEGYMVRGRYSKTLEATHTTFWFTGYRYSEHYNDLSDAIDSWDSANRGAWYSGDFYHHDASRKYRNTLSLSQTLGDFGSVSFSGTRNTYWNSTQHSTGVEARYSLPLKYMLISANWSRNTRLATNGRRSQDSITSLWFSIPIGRWLGGNVSADYQLTSASSGADTHSMGLYGDALNQKLHWDVHQQMYTGTENHQPANSALRLTWRGKYAQLGGNYSYSQAMRQTGADISGTLIAHQHGVTAGQPAGDTIALVEAPGASGVAVGGWPGVATDFRGYATLGYLSAYQKNTVALNPATLSGDAELKQTDAMVVPTEGAVVRAKFATLVGGRGLVSLVQSNGQPVPFGAMASVSTDGGDSGVVGDEGQVYLTGLQQTGHLHVQWGKALTQQCSATYHLPQHKGQAGIYTLQATCINGNANAGEQSK